jgi:NhaA family Na+:H+ antiporter
MPPPASKPESFPSLEKPPIEILIRPFQRFASQEAAGGLVLFLATVVALVWANSPWAESYFAYWQGYLEIGAGRFTTSHSIHHWINDGLMAIFFFVMGMEIKRELLVGELKSPRAAALPILAALGGVVAPALIYLAATGGTDAAKGWAIPTATDIAFSLGVLALLGSRVPVGLKVFLAALAIVDDIVAVLVIALFYSGDLSTPALVSAAIWYALAWGLNFLGIRSAYAYAIVGIGLWVSVFNSGIHATIAGVLLAFAIPARSRIDAKSYIDESRRMIDRFEAHVEPGERFIHHSEALEALHQLERRTENVQAPLLRFEHELHSLVSFWIMPLFALANAGVRVLGERPDVFQPAAIGTALGLVIGKPLGVTLFSWLAVRFGIGQLPENVNWRHIHGAGWLAGIGFTMALFIAELGFGEGDKLAASKLAIVAASTVAGIIGSIILLRGKKQENGSAQ